MTAPVSPPATSVAQTAAQVKALLDGDLATAENTKGIYIYVDPSVIQAPGYAVHDLGTLLKLAPSTATAKSAANLATILDTNLATPDSTKVLYVFEEPSTKVAAGDTENHFIAALNLAPSTATVLDTDGVADVLEAGTDYVYAFSKSTSVGSHALAAADVTAALETSLEAGTIPSWGVDVATKSVRTLGDALVYTTIDDVPTIQTFFPKGTVLQVLSATVLGAELYFQVVAGDYSGKFIRHLDVENVIH